MSDNAGEQGADLSMSVCSASVRQPRAREAHLYTVGQGFSHLFQWNQGVYLGSLFQNEMKATTSNLPQ